MAIEMKGLTPLLQVFDMPTSIHFYRDVLGFEVVGHSGRTAEDAGWVWLRRGTAELMLNTAYEQEYRPPAPERARGAAHRDTCLYIACPDIEGAFAHLREKGLDVKQPTVAHYGMKQLYLKDPDGFGLCLQWPENQGRE